MHVVEHRLELFQDVSQVRELVPDDRAQVSFPPCEELEAERYALPPIDVLVIEVTAEYCQDLDSFVGQLLQAKKEAGIPIGPDA
jgi:hypothetical protein